MLNLIMIAISSVLSVLRLAPRAATKATNLEIKRSNKA